MMINILLNAKDCDFDGVLKSIISILKRSDNNEQYAFFICGDSKNESISDQMLDYFNDIVIGFNYKNKVVKAELNVANNYEYVTLENQNCELEDILSECKILKDIYQGGVYYA